MQKNVALILLIVSLIGVIVYFSQNKKSSEVPTSVSAEVEEDVIVSKTDLSKSSETMTPEQIEQQKIKENIEASQNKQSVSTVSKNCVSGIRSEDSFSAEYSALVHSGWTFKKAIVSDFDCDNIKDVIVASYVSDASQNFFKADLQFFQKIDGSWKLINENDFLGEPFEINSTKTEDGANAVKLTFSSGIERIVWIRNGYPTGI